MNFSKNNYLDLIEEEDDIPEEDLKKQLSLNEQVRSKGEME